MTRSLDGEDSPGKYRIRLFDASAADGGDGGDGWVTVTIDDLIPCDPRKAWFDVPVPLFAKNHGAELYVMLLEKVGAATRTSARAVGATRSRRCHAGGALKAPYSLRDGHSCGAGNVMPSGYTTQIIAIRPGSAGRVRLRSGDLPSCHPYRRLAGSLYAKRLVTCDSSSSARPRLARAAADLQSAGAASRAPAHSSVGPTSNTCMRLVACGSWLVARDS